jgi:hypothetical protein
MTLTFDQFVVESGAFCILGRGYLDFARLPAVPST